jgi:hemerythrin
MRPRSWEGRIETGIEPIDREHRLQAGLLDALERTLRESGARDLVRQTLRQLADFTAVHFESEELMMRLYSYPRADAHAVEHERLLDQLSEMVAAVEAEREAELLDLVGPLRSWLVGHIRTMDHDFALWCASTGIDPGAHGGPLPPRS